TFGPAWIPPPATALSLAWPPLPAPHAVSARHAAAAAGSAQVLPRAVISDRLAFATVGNCRYPVAMPEEASAVELRPHVRLIHGMRRPANWLQLVRFGLVGGLGFIVNLAVYALCVH